MKKYINITVLFAIFLSGCVKQSHIDFTSSKTFFSSFNEKEIIQREFEKVSPKINGSKKNKITNKNERIIPKTNSLKKNKIYNNDERIISRSLLFNLSSYKKQLEKKIGFNEYKILKIFKNPNLKIKHGKIKNFQFHLKSCHLDLFFLDESETYIFKHFDIRPSNISSNLNKRECFKELNNNFILIRDPN